MTQKSRDIRIVTRGDVSSLVCFDCGFQQNWTNTPEEILRYHAAAHRCAPAAPDAASPTPVDLVNHPPHYTQHPSGVECIEITEHFSFCVGNAIKYLWRADHKNGLEDLRKAEWYVKREIARREKLTAEVKP